MDELLGNPAVQGGVIPFLVAMAGAAALARTRLLGLAIGAAFLIAATLAIGFSFESLTSTRKLILLGAGSCGALVIIELSHLKPGRPMRAVLALLAGAGGVWMGWRVLQQQEAGLAIAWGVGVAAYLAALVDSSNSNSGDPVRSASSALMLGLASGVLALLGASASLALVGIAIGAGAGAVLLVQMLTGRRAPLGWTLALPGSLIAGLIGVLAVLTGDLRWFQLVALLAIPWAARLVPATERPVWVTALLTSAAATVPALIAVLITWFTAGLPAG